MQNESSEPEGKAKVRNYEGARDIQDQVLIGHVPFSVNYDNISFIPKSDLGSWHPMTVPANPISVY